MSYLDHQVLSPRVIGGLAWAQPQSALMAGALELSRVLGLGRGTGVSVACSPMECAATFVTTAVATLAAGGAVGLAGRGGTWSGFAPDSAGPGLSGDEAAHVLKVAHNEPCEVLVATAASARAIVDASEGVATDRVGLALITFASREAAEQDGKALADGLMRATGAKTVKFAVAAGGSLTHL
jgi:hypothetical protein